MMANDGLSFMNPPNRLVKIESEQFSAPAALKKTTCDFAERSNSWLGETRWTVTVTVGNRRFSVFFCKGPSSSI